MTPLPLPPQRLAGLGFREGASPASLLDALARAGGQDLRHLAVPEVKARHPAVLGLAQLGYRILAVPAPALAAQPTTTESAAARARHGTGSVAEGCALAALGPGAVLLGARVISADRMATAALAMRAASADLPAVGNATAPHTTNPSAAASGETE